MNKPDRDLFLYGLKRGDLVQLHSDNIEEGKPSSAKVIVGSGYIKDDATPNWMSTSWYFRYIDSGALGIYLSRVISTADMNSEFWRSFHQVHCDGTTCVVHEKYLFPTDWVYDPNNLTSPKHTLYTMGILKQTGSGGAK